MLAKSNTIKMGWVSWRYANVIFYLMSERRNPRGPVWKYKYVSLAALPIFLSGGIEALFVLHQVQQSRVTDLDTVFTGHQHIVRTKTSVNAVLKVNKCNGNNFWKRPSVMWRIMRSEEDFIHLGPWFCTSYESRINCFTIPSKYL